MSWSLLYDDRRDIRVFRKLPDDGRVYVADQSGIDPDCTEDGPTWIDFSRRLEIGPKWCMIPVVVGSRSDEEGLRTGCEYKLATWLLDNTSIAWEISYQLDPIKRMLRTCEEQVRRGRVAQPVERDDPDRFHNMRKGV